MRIKEFSVRRYGPLSDTGKIVLGNFNLFWGKNEYGKSLTIDALVKLLMQKKNSKNFENIDRVEEIPDGYVVIENDKGKEIKLSKKNTLMNVANLSAEESSNIFIVRNSNLSIARDFAEENNFYINLTDRLTGLKSEEIRKIKDKLHEIAKLTPKGQFKNDRESGQLKDRLEKAKRLSEEIDILIEKIKSEGLDKAEQEFLSLKKRIEIIEREIEDFENAKKREEYEKRKKDLDDLKNYLESFKSLNDYNENDAELWRKLKEDIERYEEEREDLFRELQAYEEHLNEITDKLSRIESNFQILKNKKRTIDEEIKPDMKNYESNGNNVAKNRAKDRFFNFVFSISAILLAISLFGLVVKESLIFYIMAGIFSVFLVAFGIVKLRFIKDKAKLDEIFKNINLTLSKFRMNADSIEEILVNIQKLDEEYEVKSNELNNAKIRKDELESAIEKIHGKKIPEIKNKIRSAEKEIEEIKRKSREDSWEEYIKKLEKKNEQKNFVERQKSVLKSHFGVKSQNLEENIAYWNNEIKKLEKFKDSAKEIEYSEDRKLSLMNEKQKLESKREQLKENMDSIQKKLKNVEDRLNKILVSEDEYFYCDTSLDLEVIKDKLKIFINETEKKREDALKVIEIFEKIESEEKEKVSELFGKDSLVSKYFSEITDGLYEEVVFDSDNGKIKIVRKDGAEIDAGKLSGGAYDQLYFSIRLALGEKLLKERKGFFIMDDPFIKADLDRLKKQIRMLEKISESGWQILYFSAKDEIKEVLNQSIEAQKVNYIPIKAISF